MVGHDDAVHAGIHGAQRIRHVKHALDDQLAAPLFADTRQVRPIQMAAVGEVAQHIPGNDRGAARGIVILEVRHAVTQHRLQQRAEGPARVQQAIGCEPQCGPQGRREARPHIVLAVRSDGCIYRDHQLLEARPCHTVDQCVDLFLLTRQIGLEPDVRPHACDVFQAGQGRTAHDHGNVGFLRGLCQYRVAAIRGDGTYPHWRNAEGRGISLAPELSRCIYMRYIAHHARHEPEFVEDLAVLRQRCVGLHPPGHVGIHEAGEVALRGLGEVVQAQQRFKLFVGVAHSPYSAQGVSSQVFLNMASFISSSAL